MGKHRQYSDKEKAGALAALDANGGNLYQTSRQIGIPLSTLKEWRDNPVHPDVAELHTQKRGELQVELRKIAYDLIAAVPGALPKANLQQIATTLGIVIDKMQLLSGLPTERNELIVSDEDRANRITALLDAARTRRDGQPAHPTDD